MSVKLAEHGVFIHATLTEVWETIVRVKAWGSWNSRVGSIELLETPKPGAIGRVFPLPGGRPFAFRITELEKPVRFRWERPFAFGTHLSLSSSLTRNAEGTVVTLEAHCEGALEKPVRLLRQRNVQRELEHYGLSLKAHCEELQLKARVASGDEAPLRRPLPQPLSAA